MYMLVDATPAGLPPEAGYNPVAAGFMVSFIIVGGLFIISLFMGVVVEQYKKNHELYTSGNITPSQKKVWRIRTNETKNMILIDYSLVVCVCVVSDEYSGWSSSEQWFQRDLKRHRC